MANLSAPFQSDTPAAPPPLLGELTFSAVLTAKPSLELHSAAWYNRLQQFRAGIPFFVVHDFGHVLRSRPGYDIQIGIRKRSLSIAQSRFPQAEFSSYFKILDSYCQVLELLSKTELAQIFQRNKPGDNLFAALLGHLLSGIHFYSAPNRGFTPLPLQEKLFQHLEPAQLLDPQMAQDVLETIANLVEQKTQLLIAVEQIDYDTLKLLQMTSSDAQASTFFLEIHQLFTMPSVHDIANFSLDLLPSVLETKRTKGSQSYSVDGFATIENRGELESLLPSELVYEDELFDRRYLHKEQLFYGREKDRENKERLHYFLVDASASMRGLRTVFARGVALAMAKKALLAGDDVIWRYFDSRLYEKQVLYNDNLRVPYLLGFRGEKGRNTTQVFTDLHRELKRLQENPTQEVVVTVFSHGRCVIRQEVVLGIKNYAKLFGVFVLPESEELHLEYLAHLDGYHMIHAAVLEDRKQRQNKALELLGAQEVGFVGAF